MVDRPARMMPRRRRRWLSELRHDAQRRPVPIANRVRALRQFLASPRGVVTIILVVFAIQGIAVFVPQVPNLPSDEHIQGYLATLWQVTGGILAVAVVFLVLSLEAAGRVVQGAAAWRQFGQSSAFSLVIAFSAGTIAAAGLGALLLLPTASADVLRPQGLGNLLLVDIVLFCASIIVLVRLYANAFEAFRPDWPRQLIEGGLATSVEAATRELWEAKLEEDLFSDECKAVGLLYQPWAQPNEPMRPIRVTTSGVVVDIDLRQIAALARMIPKGAPSTIVVLGPRRRVTSASTIAVLAQPNGTMAAIEVQVNRCYQIRQPQRDDSESADREVEETLRIVGARGLDAIRSGDLERLVSALETLQRSVEVAIRLAREYQVALEEIIASLYGWRWRIVDRPISEYRRLQDAAARVGDIDIAREMARWPTTIMQHAIKSDDRHFFVQAASLLPPLFLLSDEATAESVRTLLRDSAWRRLRDFGFQDLRRRFADATDPEVVRVIGRYAADLHRTYVELLKTVIDADNATYLRIAARGYWGAIPLDFLARELKVDADLAEADEDDITFDLLTRARLDGLRDLDRVRDRLWLALGGWLCLRIAEDRSLVEVVAVFDQLASPFAGDFGRLWQGFVDAVSMGDSPLREWESLSQPEEGGFAVETTQYLALFFMLTALRMSIPRGERGRSRIASPSNALQLQGLVVSAKDAITRDPNRWRPILAANWEGRFVELRELIDGFVADEQRRDRDRVIESRVSMACVTAFLTALTSSWRQETVLRQLLEEAGVIEYRSGEAPPSARQSRYESLLNKRWFIEDSVSDGAKQVGEERARFVAAWDDEQLYETLRSSARRSRQGGRTLMQVVTVILRRIRRYGHQPDLILLLGGRPIRRLFEESQDYVPSYRLPGGRSGSFLGTFAGVALYTIRSQRNELLVIARAALEPVVQYGSTTDAILRSIDVSELSLDEVRTLAAERLRDQLFEDGALAEGDLIDGLRQRVRLRLDQALGPVTPRQEAIFAIALRPRTTTPGDTNQSS